MKRLRHDKLFVSPGVQSKTDMVIDSTFTANYSLFTAFIESFECTGVSALADIEEAHSMLARGSWPASKSLRMGIGMGVGMGMSQAFDMSRVRFFSYVCRLRLLFFLLLSLSCLVQLDTLGAQINNNWRNARIAYGKIYWTKWTAKPKSSFVSLVCGLSTPICIYTYIYIRIEHGIERHVEWEEESRVEISRDQEEMRSLCCWHRSGLCSKKGKRILNIIITNLILYLQTILKSTAFVARRK